MHIILLTGSIGSGKTTASRIFNNSGYRVINSDLIAKNIIKTDLSLQKKISSLFSDNSIFTNRVNWRKLRKYVFANNKDKILYESMVHTYFFKELNIILKNRKKNILLEFPLIEKSHNIKFKHKIVSVLASDLIRIKRIKKRNIPQDILKKIILTQKNNQFYRKKSNFVINNNGTMYELNNKIMKLIKILDE